MRIDFPWKWDIIYPVVIPFKARNDMDIDSVGKSKAEVIRDYIDKRIRTREYVHRIPPLNDLAHFFKVNIKTVKRAVGELENQGVLYSHKGKGTFICNEDAHLAPILYIGRGGKEISQIIATELASAVNVLGMDYLPYSFLMPQERLDGGKLKLPMCNDLAGILVEGDLIERFREIPSLPVVPIHNMGPGHRAGVTADHAGGIRQAVNYLYSLGHRKLAYLGAEELAGRPCEGQSEAKREAFETRTRELGIPALPEWNIPAYYRVEAGYRAAQALFHCTDRPTAVICVNDEVALGVLNACDEIGIRVPDEFSVIGFDDRSPAIMRKPFLTTVRVDFRRMVQEALRELDRRIRNRNTGGTANVLIPTELIIRESTGPARSGDRLKREAP